MEKTITIIPKVDEAQEFMEIAFDFSNPLDLVREAISNAFDAGAKNIGLDFSVINEYGEKILKITITDDGTGMDELGISSFFDLGNSLSRNDENKIGEKGHGTKVYFNSSKIEVLTYKDGKKYLATMLNPNRDLHDRKIPVVTVKVSDNDKNVKGTQITIMGYNNNRRKKFTHEQLKDYIIWFTKFGSVEKEFGIIENSDVVLSLKGINRREPEILHFGHIFPKESKTVSDLFDEHLVDAPKWYCKKYIREGHLKSQPETEYKAVFYIEGAKVKYQYNQMLTRSGYRAPDGAYPVRDRYGIWLCKDYMPVQKKNEWITSKGNEFLRFHAFINCQELRLTANRGSVENTPSEVLNDLEEVVTDLYHEITESSDWEDMEWLESQVEAYNTTEKERKSYKRRIEKVNRGRTAEYKGMNLIEPQSEIGVFSLYMQLSCLDSSIFPFTVVDYDTHDGIDVIVKAIDTIPIKSSKLYYVEFKNFLEKKFNHTFINLHSIVCWDINTNVLKHNEEVKDIDSQPRKLQIVPPAFEGDYTRYYLDSLRASRKIEVFVLKYYLKEKFGIDFLPRTADSVV